jgi:hypothetical protein
MSSKLVIATLAAAISFGALAPTIALAKDAPKNKAACEKVSTMRWDETSGKCVKR